MFRAVEIINCQFRHGLAAKLHWIHWMRLGWWWWWWWWWRWCEKSTQQNKWRVVSNGLVVIHIQKSCSFILSLFFMNSVGGSIFQLTGCTSSSNCCDIAQGCIARAQGKQGSSTRTFAELIISSSSRLKSSSAVSASKFKLVMRRAKCVCMYVV